MRSKKRVTWLILGAVALFAIIIRAVIALGNANRMPDNPLGLTGADAIVIGVLLSGVCTALIILWVNRASARTLVSVREKFADRPVYLTTVLPQLVDGLRDVDGARGIKVGMVCALVFSEYECAWWRKSWKVAEVGRVISEVPIEFSIGTGEHFGRPYPAIIASTTVNGVSRAIPIALMSEVSRRLIASWATDDELRTILFELQEASASTR